MIDELIQERILRPLLDLLKQGVTPEKMALTIALGVTIGVFPALGLTTILCTIVALTFRLNLAAMQLVNYFMYPLQVILLLPFFRLGERVFHAPHLPISAPQILAMAKNNLQSTVKFLWFATWHAIVVWTVLAPVAIAVLYLVLAPLLRDAVRSPAAADLASGSAGDAP
jgi:uncharacterized protein (DUF2062 family)